MTGLAVSGLAISGVAVSSVAMSGSAVGDGDDHGARAALPTLALQLRTDARALLTEVERTGVADKRTAAIFQDLEVRGLRREIQ